MQAVLDSIGNAFRGGQRSNQAQCLFGGRHRGTSIGIILH
jgi:hypothetical protein